MQFNLWYALLLFCLAGLLDAVYASYTFAVMKHKSLRAGALSSFIYFLSAIGILSYVDNKLYLIPLSLGAFAGTVCVVEFEKRKKQRPKSKQLKIKPD